MEAMVGRQYWDHWDSSNAPRLQALRSEAGEKMVLQDNFFIEKVLPGAVLRQLSDEEMAEYVGRLPSQARNAGHPHLAS